MEIQVPEEPVVALFGHDATLRCSFSPDANFSVAELSLIWQLTDTKRLVHGFSGGRDRLQDQGRGYANRTALFYDQLARGNVSLLLRRVRIADEGSFTCFVRVRDHDSAAVTLQVAGEEVPSGDGLRPCQPGRGLSAKLEANRVRLPEIFLGERHPRPGTVGRVPVVTLEAWDHPGCGVTLDVGSG